MPVVAGIPAPWHETCNFPCTASLRAESPCARPRREQFSKEVPMNACEVCGNQYDKTFEVKTARGESHVFDCFECAIHALAPECSHCGCRIVGHGMEAEGEFYCCAHCAGHRGQVQLQDRAEGQRLG